MMKNEGVGQSRGEEKRPRCCDKRIFHDLSPTADHHQDDDADHDDHDGEVGDDPAEDDPDDYQLQQKLPK